MTRRAAPATTAGPPGPRSPASGRRTSRRGGGGDTAPTAEPPAPEVPRRTRAKRGQGDQLREQILDAAYELLMETGSVDKVSTRAVARRVGCSSPALYLHFPDKAALLWAACNRQFQRLADLIATAVADVDDPVEALRAAGRAYITFGVEHAEEYRVMMMVPDTVVWNPPMAELAHEAGFDVLHGLIERAMAGGQLREDDPTMVAITVWSTVHGVVAIRVAKPAFDWPPLDEHIERTLTVLLTGLGPGAGSSPPPRNAGRPARKRRSAAGPSA